jgi:hypothetical protein
MGFTAKVIADGRFFMGDTDVETGRDAHKIEAGRTYSGNVLDSMPTETHYVEFSKARRATFTSAQLEELPGSFRLIPVR